MIIKFMEGVFCGECFVGFVELGVILLNEFY